jgi:16S rRNA (cytosine1402-N4)-methyltransferase
MHQPVLLKEVIEYLNPQKGEFFIDGTMDGGGHAKAIIEKIAPGGIFLGIEWDNDLFNEIKKEFATFKEVEIILKNKNYAETEKILKEENLPLADGMILDLGFSSWHINKSKKGFSFNKDEPLNMIYNTNQTQISAFQIINYFPTKKIAEIIKNFGEEKNYLKIAKIIEKNRKVKLIKTSKELGEIIAKNFKRKSKIHPATKTFQALRIYINKELENLEKLLKTLPKIIKSGGRVGIITFHSLEDRLVKKYFKNLAKEKKAILINKKVIRPNYLEIKNNPQARSAKLRVIKIL